ncbi:MAG TPA: hypothetical protein VMH81_25460 [Bryobacteraceae bacterium]|nr:hypothetical protein [Bryobacteraceae bacterium]
MLSDTPRQKLAAMIALDGIKVASDAKLCEALLRDYCGEYRLEIAALSAAVRWGIPKSLQDPGHVPPATLRASLARRLQENHGLAEETAFWAVDAWASVLANQAGISGSDAARAELAAETYETRSMPASPAPVQSPYQPPSPALPPLPQAPSGPQATPPPKPAYQPPPLPGSTYQPASPALPPLPVAPSGPQAAPPPRPPMQPQSPVLPPLPKPPSGPQASPVLRQPYQPPPLPAQVKSPVAPSSPPQPPAFLEAANALESRQSTPQLLQVQTYLKSELKQRKPVALEGELRAAGVQPLTARRLVSQARRSEALRHLGLAFLVFVASLIYSAMYAALHIGSEEINYVVIGCAFLYLTYRGIRIIGTL